MPCPKKVATCVWCNNMTARFNLEFPDDYKHIIRDLMTSTGLATQKDVFENSLALFGWAVREVARGRVIASLDEKDKTYNQIHMPSLMKVAASSALGKEEPNGEGGDDNTSPRQKAFG